jgi:hypothetical protein
VVPTPEDFLRIHDTRMENMAKFLEEMGDQEKVDQFLMDQYYGQNEHGVSRAGSRKGVMSLK